MTSAWLVNRMSAGVSVAGTDVLLTELLGMSRVILTVVSKRA